MKSRFIKNGIGQSGKTTIHGGFSGPVNVQIIEVNKMEEQTEILVKGDEKCEHDFEEKEETKRFPHEFNIAGMPSQMKFLRVVTVCECKKCGRKETGKKSVAARFSEANNFCSKDQYEEAAIIIGGLYLDHEGASAFFMTRIGELAGYVARKLAEKIDYDWWHSSSRIKKQE